jgi:hypothetical protein
MSLDQSARRIVLLSPLTIGAAVSATATTPVTGLGGMEALTVEAKFLYGAGGTNATAYVQTSLDGGLSWIDIMCFQFTTAAANKISSVTSLIAPAAQAFAPTDGSLTANTIIQGVLGDRLRLKYVTTGTYTGATSLGVYAIVRG